MDDPFRYRAFISYSHKDRRWADWLHRELERYKVPPRLALRLGGGSGAPGGLRPVFRDRDELPSASSLPEVVHEALARSEALIVICSPDAARSNWVDDEIRTFQRLGRSHRIFCLIVSGEPRSGDERECFPGALLRPESRMAGSPVEPVAADARPGQDGRQRAKLRLIAGLLGVGLDELLQREMHQRHRRMFALSMGTSLIALVMAGLAIFAFHAREEAERQRAGAENLVGFLLGDLREKLDEIGRLDLYRSVGDKSMEYFLSLGKDSRDEVLAQRAKALRQIGQARLDQAEAEAALEAFNESLAISGELAARAPGRADWQIALAESHFYVGLVHWQRDDLEAAGKALLNQLAIVDAVSKTDPQDGELLEQRAYAWTNYGRLLEVRGALEESQQAYDTVMTIARLLLQLDPENVDWQLELGFAHNNLGKLSMSRGQLAEAEAHFRRDLEIKQPISERRPNHALWLNYLGVSHYFLGQLLGTQGRVEDSREHLRRALEIIDALLLSDPEVSPWLHRKGTFERELSTILRMAGELEAAEAHVVSSLGNLDRLIAANPDNLLWRRDRALSATEAARQAAMRGEFDAALQFAESALESARNLATMQPNSMEARKLEAMAWLTMGDVARQAARDESAAPAWQAALAIIDEHFATSTDPVILDMQASALARLERDSEASQSTARLEQMGYLGRFEFPGRARP